MQRTKRIEQATAMAGILSNPMRMAIVTRLRKGPCIVGDLVDGLGEGQATVSKQLGILRDAGLLRCCPQGRCREYTLASPALVEAALDALATLAADAARKGAECRARRSSAAEG